MTRALSYARAEDLKALITATALSQRGSIQTDARTNTIIINDLPERLERAAGLLTTLDVPQPQVEIEARIVQLDRNKARDLGIDWNFGGRVDPALGTSTGLAFPLNDEPCITARRFGSSAASRRIVAPVPGVRLVKWKLSSAAMAGPTMSPSVSAGGSPRCVKRSLQNKVPVVLS